MARSSSASRVKPLDGAGLDALAVHYLARFATTEKKLANYLRRKIAERGWTDEGNPPIDVIVARCATAGYVDDRGFAQTRASSLARRGYGQVRVKQALHAAGISREIADSCAPDKDEAFAAAEVFARRRRFGQFGDGVADPAQRQRQFAAMIRAGHHYDLARHFVTTLPQNGVQNTKCD